MFGSSFFPGAFESQRKFSVARPNSKALTSSSTMSGRRRVSGRTRSGRTVPSRSIPRELTLWFRDNVPDVSRIQRTGPTTFRNPLTDRQNIIPSAENLPSFLRRQQRTLTARKAKEDAVRLVSIMRPLNWAPHDALDSWSRSLLRRCDVE